MGKNNRQRREIKKRRLNRSYPKRDRQRSYYTLLFDLQGHRPEPWQKRDSYR